MGKRSLHRPVTTSFVAPGLTYQEEGDKAQDCILKAEDRSIPCPFTRENALPFNHYYDPKADAKAIASYYAGAPGEGDPKGLASYLKELTSSRHTNPVDYSPRRYLYALDLHPDGKLHSIYSGKSVNQMVLEENEENRLYKNPMATGMGCLYSPMDTSISLALESTKVYYNCEHVVPQSWYSKREPMRGDLHHLFTCERGCNSARGNTPYGEFGSSKDTIRNDCGRIDRSSGRFEPDAGKGAVARATLYFMVRYPEVKHRYDDQDVEMLKRWSKEDPVSLYERQRNQKIEKVQGNRNPFIDFPEWVNQVDFNQL